MLQDKKTVSLALFGLGTVIVGGTLAATSGVFADSNRPLGAKVPASKELCKNGGFAELGFKNQGQCVKFAVAADKASGYTGNGKTNALAAGDALGNDVATADSAFRASVHQLAATTQGQVKTGGKVHASSFKSSFDASSARYDTEVAAALAAFRSSVESAASTAQSKDQFINRFNQAKADYLNALEAAKNKLAGSLNATGNATVKDRFMNPYNAVKDAFGNELEGIKNDFAATLG